jgi:histidinol-phosphate/aromatic aminotransferase/cobyric acid decarboxylase-like protein
LPYRIVTNNFFDGGICIQRAPKYKVLLRTFSSGKETAEMLRGKGVLVRADYPAFEKYIRVSLGLPEDMRAFWSAWDALMPHHPM